MAGRGWWPEWPEADRRPDGPGALAFAAEHAAALDFHRWCQFELDRQLAATAGYAAGFAWRYGSYHHPGPVAAGPLALSAVCLALLGVSGFLGGKLAFRYGVRVADEAAQASGYTSQAQDGPHLITPRRTS